MTRRLPSRDGKLGIPLYGLHLLVICASSCAGFPSTLGLQAMTTRKPSEHFTSSLATWDGMGLGWGGGSVGSLTLSPSGIVVKEPVNYRALSPRGKGVDSPITREAQEQNH